MPVKREATMEPIDEAVDHVCGPSAGRLTVEYGDYECPYSRQAFREIGCVGRRLSEGVRFTFRRFPLTDIHPDALAASAAAEAAALRDRFWDMHEFLFHRQSALEDHNLRRYAAELELDVALFDGDRAGAAVLGRVGRDVESGMASGEVGGHAHPVHRRSRAPRRLRRGHLVGGAGRMSAICSHTDSIELSELPDEIAGCEDCLAIGGTWVHLRMCQSCGRIGSCDSSPHRHASAHTRTAGHPIACSAETGEEWSWCYVDDVAFVVTEQ